MATITPDNLTVKFNLKGSVILAVEVYNELLLRANQYDAMLFDAIQKFEVVDKEPTNWSKSTCTIEGYFEIPEGIFDAVVDSIVSKLLTNDAWMRSLVQSDEHWLDLDNRTITAYKPSSVHVYDLLDNKQFAEKFISIDYESDDAADNAADDAATDEDGNND